MRIGVIGATGLVGQEMLGLIASRRFPADELRVYASARSEGRVLTCGDREVVCEVLRRPKGLQAFRIREMDDSTAVHPSQLPQRTHVVVEPESDWERAIMKWFNRLRGFGFAN